MKNFLELLDTKEKLDVEMSLESIIDNGPPWVTVKVNDIVLYDAYLDSMALIRCKLPVNDPFTITVSMQEKEYDQTLETAVIINSLVIDDFDIVPAYTSFAEYDNERNFTDPTNYLGFNGEWRLTVAEPFYTWRHKVTGQGWLLQPNGNYG